MHQLNPLDPCLTLEKLAMKKTLIALAVLTVSGASFAQSSVSIDGVMDAGFQSRDYKGTSVNGVAGNGSTTSQINFRGTEDLGGGLKANFRVETDWNTVSNNANTGVASSLSTGANFGSATTATTQVPASNQKNSAAGTFGNGEIRVGLSGGFGAVNFGAVNYNTLGTYLTGQPFGTAIGSGFRAIFINDAQAVSSVRAENALMYVTPSFSGFNASLYYSGKQSKANSVAASATKSTTGLNSQQSMFSTSLGAYDQQGTTEVGVNYANGPFAASFSSLKNDFGGIYTGNAATQTNLDYTQTVNTLGANYAFGDAKVFILNQTNKTSGAPATAVDNNTTSVSGTYTLGATVLMAQYGELKNISGVKSKMSSLGADYNLSKRTALYARYESIDDKAGAIAAVAPLDVTATGKRTLTAVGIRAAF
jgi:predicted porin